MTRLNICDIQNMGLRRNIGQLLCDIQNMGLRRNIGQLRFFINLQFSLIYYHLTYLQEIRLVYRLVTRFYIQYKITAYESRETVLC